VFLAALALGWAVAGGADDRSANQFLAALQAASDRDDRAAIAGMVQYPIRTFISGWIIPIVDRKTFITSFDAFFTDEIKDLIAEAAARPRVMKENEVIVLGNGALRAMRINGRFRIIGIVPPPPSRKVRGARRGTTTVSFRTGESSAAFTGTLAAGEHERYVVRASRNELLEVRVERVRGRDIVARVFDAANEWAQTERFIWIVPYNRQPSVSGVTFTPVGQNFTATVNATDPDTAAWDAMLEYRYDFEGDGIWDTKFEPTPSISLLAAYRYTLLVEVKDRFHGRALWFDSSGCSGFPLVCQ